MKKILLLLIILIAGGQLRSQHNVLYDITADQFIPYQFVPLERRNISPDCEQRVTSYPVFTATKGYNQITTANARIRRMYTYYMSDTFVDELQKRFHQVVLNYQKHFPRQLNCINEQKIYAVNFTSMEVSIAACQNGNVIILNSLFYTVANAPVGQIQNNIYSEVIQVNLNNGSLERNPSLIRKDKEQQFVELVKRQLDLYLIKYRNRGGTINQDYENYEDSESDIDYNTGNVSVAPDYPVSDIAVEEISDMPADEPTYSESPTYNRIDIPELAAPKKTKREGVDSAVSLIKFKDLQVYWRNFTLYVRVSSYADMAAYIPNGIIEIDLSSAEAEAYLVSSPSKLLRSSDQFTDAQISNLLYENGISARIPFYEKEADTVSGVRTMELIEEQSSYGTGNYVEIRRVKYRYGQNGKIEEVKTYYNKDTVAASRKVYVYKGSELKQIMTYDRNGNVSAIQPAASLSITREKGYYFIRETSGNEYSSTAGSELRMYVLDGRVIIEPRNEYVTEEDYSYNQNSRVLYFGNNGKRTAEFILDQQSSVTGELTSNGVVPVIRKYFYNGSGELISTPEVVAQVDNGTAVLIQGAYDENFREYVTDAAGRVIKFTERSYGAVNKVVSLSYSGSNQYPDTIISQEPGTMRTVRYRLIAQ